MCSIWLSKVIYRYIRAPVWQHNDFAIHIMVFMSPCLRVDIGVQSVAETTYQTVFVYRRERGREKNTLVVVAFVIVIVNILTHLIPTAITQSNPTLYATTISILRRKINTTRQSNRTHTTYLFDAI